VQSATLYAALTLKPEATADEIKQAWRRLARQNHPDVNKEPDAEEMFKRIKGAYDVLGDPLKRRKYDAGLKLEASMDYKRRHRSFVPMVFQQQPGSYRAPLRCGLLLVEGTPGLVFTVNSILSWSDITRADGKTLVTSWDLDSQSIRKEWV
jgi:curved DNA-binding protein CbpA